MLRIVELIAEAIRPDGGWVGVGESVEGSEWILMARVGRTAWIRSLPPHLALARFLDWGNLRMDGDSAVAPTMRLVVHRPERFRIDPEALRKIGMRREKDGSD